MGKTIQIEKLNTDILIIGGGTAGCYAAYTLGQKGDYKVLIAEKANIKRSGCLAAGVNAINAYITEGRVPQDYVDYCKNDAKGIVREDLLLSISGYKKPSKSETIEIQPLGQTLAHTEQPHLHPPARRRSARSAGYTRGTEGFARHRRRTTLRLLSLREGHT